MKSLPDSHVVAIVGSREFPELDRVRDFVRSLPEDACVISGGARGVDQAAEVEAQRRGLFVESYRPVKDHGIWRIARYLYHTKGSSSHLLPGEFKTFAQCAHARNSWIINVAVATSGCLVAFWTGQVEHSGTYSVIEKARKAGVLFEIFKPHQGD